MTEMNALGRLTMLKLLVFSILATPVVVLLSCLTVLTDGFDAPPAWSLLVVVALAILTAVLLPPLGRSVVKPIPLGLAPADARDLSMVALQNDVILKSVLSDAVFLVAVVLAFVVDAGGAVVLTVGVVLTEVLSAWQVWPGERVITGVQEALERNGGLSYLREATGSATQA